MVTGPVAFTVTVPPAPFPNRKPPPSPTFNPLLLEIDAPLLTFILPALTVMEPAGPSPPVAVEMSPPSNIVRIGVFTVRAPALPVPNVVAEIALGLFTTVSDPKLDDRPLRPEIDSCSDAVTDTMPPGPEPKVAVLIAAPSVKMIVAAWMFTSPAPPGPSDVDRDISAVHGEGWGRDEDRASLSQAKGATANVAASILQNQRSELEGPRKEP